MKQIVRAEIEGLRAVAVLPVILFHFGVSWLPGGFLGVDVFFVISGFLITRNILRDQESGRFSYRQFYERRFLRLFPALATTILLTVAISFLCLPPDEVLDLAQSSFAAVFAVSNIYFWSKVGYFDIAAHLKPLLHTWSLGVEEQFYLVWPVTLVTALRFVGVKGAAWIVCVLGVTALISSQVALGISPSTAFYWMPFRIFEFAFGILIAIPWHAKRLSGPLANMVGWFGFVSVIGSMLILRDSTPMPSVWSLFACAGAAAVIYVGNVKSVAPVLSNRVMSFIGQISYSLYLVHWPIAVFMPLDTWLDKLIALAVCFAAAIAQFYCVERPLRRSGRSIELTRAPVAAGIAVSIIGATFLTSGYALYSDGLRFRLPEEFSDIQSAVAMWTERGPTTRVGTCFILPSQTFGDFDKKECTSLEPGSKNVLVVGDSIAADNYSVLKQAYPNVHFLEATSGSCSPTDIPKTDANCANLLRFVFDDLVPKGGLEAVVLSAAWQPHDFNDGLQKSLDVLAGKVGRVILLGAPVRFSKSAPDLIFESRAITIADAEKFAYSHRLFLERDDLR
uniref:acyltransferase family protein n=1 Tax=Mesorhizobium TaxID=68287 RepID=UPI0010A954E9